MYRSKAESVRNGHPSINPNANCRTMILPPYVFLGVCPVLYSSSACFDGREEIAWREEVSTDLEDLPDGVDEEGSC